MNEKDSGANNWVKTFETSDDFVTYEETLWDFGDGTTRTDINGFVTSNVVRVAPIIRPESNQVVRGQAIRWCQHGDGNHYGILCVGGNPAYVSVRTDIDIMTTDGPVLQARPVLLDGPVPTKAWELFQNRDNLGWELIPGQHLTPRTATSQQWLAEMEMRIIPSLNSQATGLLSRRLKLQATRRAENLTNGKVLTRATAAANAKSEWLGPDYKKVCQARKAAELRCHKTDVVLHRHAASTQEIFPLWSAIGRWLTQGRKGTRLQAHAEKAQAWHQRVATECLVFETRVIPAERQYWIEERTQEMLKAESDMLEQIKLLAAKKEALGTQMSEAAKLTRLLKQQAPETLITLAQSMVPERRFQTVPVPYEDSFPNLKLNASNRMRP
jgi:hypothetical protein